MIGSRSVFGTGLKMMTHVMKNAANNLTKRICASVIAFLLSYVQTRMNLSHLCSPLLTALFCNALTYLMISIFEPC